MRSGERKSQEVTEQNTKATQPEHNCTRELGWTRMATIAGRYCCSYYSPSVLPLQPRHNLPLPPHPAGSGRGRRWTSLRVAASAAEHVQAATDAEFFQPSDSRPIMLFDGNPSPSTGKFAREHTS